MSLWEYKVITSGKGGFATPALLEKFLNDLGRDEWEIINFQAQPENFLAFTGLARRPTQRDWTLEDAAAAAAKVEAEKLRAEFEAKFRAATAPAPAEERAAEFLQEKVAPDDGFRKPIDTSHDDEPEAEEDEKDEWERLARAEDDELPTFFDAIKPHMRRNQRGPGMSVGVDYLAKKWDQSEDDLKTALTECGFVVPEDEDAKPEYLEYDGDLYWVNVNRRGELWINTKEKPRPVFRPVKAQKVTIEEESKPDKRQKAEEQRKTEESAEKPDTPETERAETPAAEPGSEAAGSAPADESGARVPKSETASAELPTGAALLKKIRPHMRRNRRGPGGSGSVNFLSRALKCNEADLKAAFTGLGLTMPASSNDKPVYLEFGNEVWWLNADSRGGLWINGREKKPGEKVGAPATEAGGTTDEPAPAEAAPAAAAPEGQPAESSVSASAETSAAPELGSAVPAGERSPAEAPAPAHSPAVPETAEPPARMSPVIADVGPAAAATAPISGLAGDAPIFAVARPLLKEGKGANSAARIEKVAEELGRSPDEVMNALVSAGMKVPEKPREKPAGIEHAGDVLWLSRNAKGELWLNAKPAKTADQKADADEPEAETPNAEESEAEGDRKAARTRTRKKPESESGSASS